MSEVSGIAPFVAHVHSLGSHGAQRAAHEEGGWLARKAFGSIRPGSLCFKTLCRDQIAGDSKRRHQTVRHRITSFQLLKPLGNLSLRRIGFHVKKMCAERQNGRAVAV